MSENQKQCMACRETISADATKCVRCGTFQNWRRHITTYGPVISFLLGLAAVVSLVAPQIEIMLLPKYKLEISKISENRETMYVEVKNAGREAIVFNQIAIYYPGGQSLMKEKKDRHIISGNTVQVLELIWDSDCKVCEARPDADAVLKAKSSAVNVEPAEKNTQATEVDLSGFPDIPDCGVVFTFYLDGKEETQTLKYEESDPRVQFGGCNLPFFEFVTASGGFG